MKYMRSIWGVLSGVVVLCGVSQAHAETQGFELGGRLGYGIPMGKVSDMGTGNNDLSSVISGMVPLQFDIGYRVIPNLMVGGYFMYGFGITGDDLQKLCDAGETFGADVSCSAHDIRLGVQAHYHFLPDQTVDPWLGAGIGYEWLGFSVEQSALGQSSTASVTGHGWEFVNLQGGVDFGLAPGIGLGPFLSLSVGQYDTSSSSCDGDGCTSSDSRSNDIDKKALHEWLTLGVRGTFVL